MLDRSAMADKRTTTGTQPIYDVARECIILFEKFHQDSESQVWEIVSASWRRFRSWAACLGVFSHRRASLDERLRFEPEVRDLVMLLLKVLREDLQRMTKIASRGSIPQRNTLSDGSYKVSSADGTQLPFSNGVQGVLDGIVGSIDRLHRLSVRIVAISRDDANLEERIANFAKQLPFDNFENAAWMIAKDKFPEAEERLITKLTKSIVFRCHRILYQRHHHKKLNHIRHSSTSKAIAPLSLTPATEKSELQEQDQGKTELTKQPQRWNKSVNRSEDALESELVPSTDLMPFRGERSDS